MEWIPILSKAATLHSCSYWFLTGTTNNRLPRCNDSEVV